MKHHTKDKGDLGVLKAQVDLAEQGYTILVPLTEHAPFDIVVYKNGCFKRIQVKYRCASNGKLCVPFNTCWSDKHGAHIQPIDKEHVDLFCVFCPDTNECYYFDPKAHNSSLTLRIEPTSNNQSKGVKMAIDYRKIKD